MSEDATTYQSSQARKDKLISLFLFIFAFLWLLPIIWTIWSSFRPYAEILSNGLFSFPRRLSFDNYSTALEKMAVFKYLINTLIILVPSVFFILFFGSIAAFSLTKYRVRFKRTLFILFTAGSLLPAQFIYYPIFKMYISFGDFFGDKTLLYDNYLGIIFVHIAVQTGFAAFVLQSHLESIPKEISEAAQVDGASVYRHFYSVILPLLRAPLLSLGIFFTVWIYNDFFWAWSLLKRDQFFPITTSLTRVGAFSRIIPDQNVLAAGAVLVALPLFILYITLRKYFEFNPVIGHVKNRKLVSPDLR